MDLLVHYTQGTPLLPGVPSQIAQYKIKEGKAKHNNTKVSFILRVSNNIHQIPCLESAELLEEWEEETKIPVKKDVQPQPAAATTDAQPAADGQPAAADATQQQPTAAPQQEFEIKKKKKSTTVGLHIDSSSHAIPPQVRTNYINAEAEWFKQDNTILEFKAISNELESYAYDLKNSVGDYGAYEKYIDPSIRQ